MNTSVLVVGGAGYIGSHTAKQLLLKGHQPIILDDLSTGHRKAAELATKGGPFYQGTYGNSELVQEILQKHAISVVMHFGAKALVEESVRDPMLYYGSNVIDTLGLLKGMLKTKAKTIIFSSTCATFGYHDQAIDEKTPQNPINPYGKSKLFVEHILKDCESAYGICAGILRYFNAAGADPEKALGEDHDPETHLIPNAFAAALKNHSLMVNGNDYPTPDGSCVRDYIHVNDLADAHIKMMELLLKTGKGHDVNLGSGKGYSVFEILAAASKVAGKEIPFKVGPRRAGDPASLVANASKAREVLGWTPAYDLHAIVKTAYEWMQMHPSGFAK